MNRACFSIEVDLDGRPTLESPLDGHPYPGVSGESPLQGKHRAISIGQPSLSWSDGHFHILIVGRIFSKVDMQSLEVIDHDIALAILQSGGAKLINDYWGGFVAFLQGEAEIRIIRDPSGEVPCYYVVSERFVRIASSADLLLSAAGRPAELDAAGIVQYLLARDLRVSRTCLLDITELLRGNCLSITSGKVQIEQLWDPWAFTARRDWAGASPSDLACLLHDKVAACIAARASEFDHVLIGVSGGLDSSIVAACLKGSHPHVTCFTLATSDPRGDERAWSRMLCSDLGLNLIEEQEGLDRIDFRRSHSAHLPRPLARMFAQSNDEVQIRLADDLGVDAYFDGAGGDNIFCYLTSAAPIADRLIVEGFGTGTLGTAMDMSRLTGASLWEAVRKGVHRAWWRAPHYSWPLDRSLLSEQASSAISWEDHPWLATPEGALPGKAGHIAWLMGIQNHLEGYLRELKRQVVHPLLSQPIVELCLAIPTWRWCSGGRNRAVARDAFRHRLPRSIIDRQTKGTPSPFVYDILRAKSDSAMAFLLDGKLQSRCLIDRSEVEHHLRCPEALTEEMALRLMLLLDVEAWARTAGTDQR
ncbi:asparagine synthase-related protein [Sphingomonas oryzagri]